MTPADFAAMMGNDGFGNGSGWWIILLFMFLGWGNGGWNGNTAANGVYPVLENQQNMFAGFGALQNAISTGFANAETAATARQMADMQQEFSLSKQISDSCCENRLATANQTATILAENCADRQAISDGVRDLLANQNACAQRIIDKLSEQDLFAERRENEALRTQINMLNLAASQAEQTAALIAALKPASTTA